VKKSPVVGLLALFGLIGTWSCATVHPTPPSFYIGDIPYSVSTQLSLDDRIAAEEAWKDLREGRADDARKIFLRLGQASPLYGVGLGYAQFALGDLEGAAASFKASIERFPDMTPAHIGLAQIFEAQGQKDEAFTQYREVLRSEPGSRWAKPRFEKLRNELVEQAYAEARAAQAAGNRDGQKKALLRVLFYAPESAGAHLELARIYGEERSPANRLVHLKAAYEAKPGDRAVLQAYADELYKSGDFGRSLDLYEKLADLEPQDKDLAARIQDLKNKLGVVELPSQYGLIPAQDAVTREDLAALIAVKFKDFFRVPAQATEILVDISTSWAQKFIVEVASRNVMSVYDNHTFQPSRIINRAEMADTVSRLVAFLEGKGVKFVPVLETRKIQIADVSPDNFYYEPILRVVSLQIMVLSPDRMFAPEKTLTGREAASILDLALVLAK
jgi:tetratricopeptide (TPR) repeat protein